MKVTIIDIDLTNPVSVGKSPQSVGYKGKFSCALVSGEATFVPTTGAEKSLRTGDTIDAETGWGLVSDFKVVGAEEMPQIVALSESGDYAVVGKIENLGGRLCAIEIGDWHFVFDSVDRGGLVPESGQRASCTIHGLELWDSNN